MGQSYSTSLHDRNVASTSIDIPEFNDTIYDKTLLSTRFFKTVRAKHGDGLVAVKIFVKPAVNDISVKKYVDHAREEAVKLYDASNAMTYSRIVETERCVYVARQYLYSSLYDRISTRPFLEMIEKKWIAFQLLSGLRDCHNRGIRHGDIKTENIMVTTWNWAYLTDFAFYKPAYLPEDNPADFSFYFDTSSRRLCYLAPERFLGHGEQGKGGLTDAMDIFSLGCVIAELFLEGPVFTLSQLLKYRKGDYDPNHTILDKIEDMDIRSLVQHMINVDPVERYSADRYLSEWRRKAFPEYFYSFLHMYMDGVINRSHQPPTEEIEGKYYRAGEADERVERIYYEFDKISFFLGYEQREGDLLSERSSNNQILPVNLDIPNYERKFPAVRRRENTANDGTLIFLTVVASAIRNTTRASVRVRACDLLLAFAERIPDEAKLDRVLPYLVALLGDESPLVVVAAIRGIAQLLEIVEVVSQVNVYVFPEYILPKLQHLPYNPSPLIRATYAECLASLADSSARFLQMAQAMKDNSSGTSADGEEGDTKAAYHGSFDSAKSDLMSHFQDHAKAFLTDTDPAVRRAFLRSVSRLCVFFGSQKANDIILSHLNTYLNDKDWMLRCAFFETIISVATFVGGNSLEDFILPLMVQALTDPEEFVIEKVIHSLSAMAQLGLFQKAKMWELVDVVSRFSMHPNLWIREACAAFIAASTRWISKADLHCIVLPMVRPFLKCNITTITELSLLDHFKKPLSRGVFDMAVTWATKTERGIFWKHAQSSNAFSFSSSFENYPQIHSRDTSNKGNFKVPKNEEDEQWLTRLRNLGMSNEDEWKLYALREYIWRMARFKSKVHSEGTPQQFNKIISLKELDIKPQTIFFEDDRDIPALERVAAIEQGRVSSSLTDALIDASKTIDSTLRRTGSKGSLRSAADAVIARRSSSLEARPASVGFSSTAFPSGLRTGIAYEDVLQRPASVGPSSERRPSMAVDKDDMRKLLTQKTLSSRTGIAALMSKGTEGAKAAPATGTVNTNAVGQVELPFARDASRQSSSVDVTEDEKNQLRALHSYRGNDPHILKLLDSLCMENFPTEILEFGPIIVGLGRRQPIRQLGGKAPGQAWRPEGVMVAQFGEHTAAINRVIVAPDQAFFATASDDGTVKIWDATRLEKNVATRARQTYRHGTGVKVRSLCFIENTHCFVSAANDGSIHIVKVDYSQTQTSSKYGKLKRLRSYQLEDGEHVLWMEHFRAESQSILLLATNKSRIIALDLRTMTPAYILQNPVHHGTPTCFVVDRRRAWLLVGTTHGILNLWDLRFRLRLKAWGLPGSTEIHKLALHPSKGRGKWVVVAGGTGQGEVSTWDIEKGTCREVYRADGGKDSGKGYEAWKVDDEKPAGLLGRFTSTPTNLMEPTPSQTTDRGVRALAVGADTVDSSSGDSSRSSAAFIITAGSDRKMRFWNLPAIEHSMVVSGLEGDAPSPSFSSTHYTHSLVLNFEMIPQAAEGSGTSARVSASGGTAMRRVGTKGRPPRSTVISLQQQELLRTHLDSVQDVAMLEVPYGMIISVDRSGVIFVFR